VPTNPYEISPPPWLEDEVLLIETAGEMPEVALAESLHHLGADLAEQEQDCLRAAAVQAYLAIIERDLDPANQGLSHFRGLGRAADNLARLTSFLGRLGWKAPPDRWAALQSRLQTYLETEREYLGAGRAYASASREQMEAVAGAIGLGLEAEQELLTKLEQLPCPDFLGLRGLMRLEAAKGACKRRQESGGKARLEVWDASGKILAAVELGLWGADDKEDHVCRDRVELIWGLLRLPQG
jgi:hypothetical protein